LNIFSVLLKRKKGELFPQEMLAVDCFSKIKFFVLLYIV